MSNTLTNIFNKYEILVSPCLTVVSIAFYISKYVGRAHLTQAKSFQQNAIQ